MTLLNTFTLAGSFGAALETAQRADEENRAKAPTSAPRARFDLPRWSAWTARTA